jgi:hypothetical protein
MAVDSVWTVEVDMEQDECLADRDNAVLDMSHNHVGECPHTALVFRIPAQVLSASGPKANREQN